MKDKLLIIIFILIIFIVPIYSIIKPDEKISFEERRELAALPKYDFSNEYVNNLEKYLLDNIPFRNNFRSIKAYFNYYVLNKEENNNIILANDMIFESNYPTNKESIDFYIDKVNSLISMTSDDNNIYFMLVPDKNYYLNKTNFLKMDYDYLKEELNKINATKIDISDVLTLSDYYRTDTHWKQENLDKVVKVITNDLNLPYQEQEYTKNKYDKFYGIFYSKAAINFKPDTIYYLSNDILNNVRVDYLENEDLDTIYNLDKLDSFDSYEVYLDGASSFIEIYNDDALTDRELIIFRDSFGSSLTPLLVPYYKKITVVDNRYISSNYFKELVTFDNQDIIFMNSSLIINNSFTLKG